MRSLLESAMRLASNDVQARNRGQSGQRTAARIAAGLRFMSSIPVLAADAPPVNCRLKLRSFWFFRAITRLCGP
jgi:hypothetical protein